MFEKLFFKILNIFIFLFFSFFIVLLLVNNSICNHDDFNSTIDSYPFFEEENGRYICNFISRVFCLYLPKFLGIHLQNWIVSVGAFIFFLIIIALIYSVTKFYYTVNKDKILIFVISLIPMLLFMDYTCSNGIHYTMTISYQYGYVLAAVFGFLFLFFLFELFIFDKKYSENSLLLYIILGFCAGNSSQIVCFSLSISIFLFLFYKYFCLKFQEKSFKKFLSDKLVNLPLISFFIGFSIMVICPGFWNEVEWRHTENFNEIISFFIPFIHKVFIVILEQKLYLITILLLSIALIPFYKYKMSEYIIKIVPVFFNITGVFIYFLMLILGGRTFPPDTEGFWVQEPFYTFYYKMALSAVIVYLLGLLISFFKENISKYLIVLFICLYVIFICKYEKIRDEYINSIIEMKFIRNIVLATDKIVLNEYSRGYKTIIIPQQYSNAKFILHYFPDEAKRYYNKIYNIDLSSVNIEYNNYNQAITHYFSDNNSEVPSLINNEYFLNNY